MIVTQVIITNAESNGSCLLAFADIEIDNMLVIHGLRVIQRTETIVFIDFPSRPALSSSRCLRCNKRMTCIDRYCSFCSEPASVMSEPKYKNVVHPINTVGRRVIHDAVINEYRRQKSLRQNQNTLVAPYEIDVESRHQEELI